MFAIGMKILIGALIYAGVSLMNEKETVIDMTDKEEI